MFIVTFLGNLGADAELVTINGNKFVKFRVAHSVKRENSSNTTWASVLLRGDGGNLAQYLVKGAKVCVIGRASIRAFSSHVTKTWEAGLDITADTIELCGQPALSQQNKDASNNYIDDAPF